MADREFDIIVYGATGYTGRLVAEYLAHHYVGRADAPKWAMAGRSLAKLEEVRDAIGAPQDTPLVVADADDPGSLTAMCNRTRVVLTTVGPYQLYGDALVEACVATGTDYADLCGEPGWMREKIDQHHESAKASGAHICFSSGFDSIPFDLGVFMLQKEAAAKFGQPAPRVKGRVRGMQGTFSGGTAASLTATMKAVAKNPKLIPILSSPFGLTPGFDGPSQPMGLVPEYDEATGKWAAPFIMATINTKNVHRTNFLRGFPYGEDFKYDEMMLTSPGEAGKAAANAVAEMLKNPFGAKPPKPGEGPTKEERDNGFYDVLFIGEMPDGATIRYGVKGKYDPGYGSTSRMLAQTGIALLSCKEPGGVGTPGSFLGEALVERLEANAELTFGVED
ncbi:saccharopine dehydrogenase family protein [Parerythrobacter lacustris]|uniref:Saccharopine dehydrogenase NADP-binding domain-containing protein n=1 Tax=Parerythrobacter lacustris TaxID=2969984 RepID=A0ABT1XLR3_9SPHN|nr:saccharopine dehydrogenase NADP-binding domain-containing protein [Parerythrobacter lacustris]MCR2832601.1 saccharopine dehydrogenase NADP-binding domain-containing protein [Parerythrobacter lacustris]